MIIWYNIFEGDSMENNIYNAVKKFKDKYPMTVGWRLKKHCKIAQMHLNPN